MILCDVNVWLALALSRHRHHAAARSWLETVQEPESLAFCRATQQGLLRLLTTEAVLRPYGNPPLGNRQAWDVYRGFLADDRIVFAAGEPPGLETAWHRLAAGDAAAPKLWMDAYLAAFAMQGGHRLATFDADFKRFTNLSLILLNPD